MGWCQAELARHLNCHVDVIWNYEDGALSIDDGHRRALSSLTHQADAAAEKTWRRPVAEMLMRDRGISQIHDQDVLEAAAESNVDVSAAQPLPLR